MYAVVLTLHSWLRWAALILGVVATLDAARGRSSSTKGPMGRPWDSWLMLAIDGQVLLGLLLYFGLSPFTKVAMAQMDAAFRNPALRFWAFTHVGLMFVAFVLIRAGRILGMTATTPEARRRRCTLCFALATLAMAAGTPWPGLAAGRPLLRWR